ncbi:MAG: hypothetical protein ACI9UN_004253 [Granulosicoccus sp.]|jgi:hypothetical protein
MVNLVVDCLRSRTSLDQLKGVWKTLERVDSLCTPFSSWVWADSWWREFALNGDKLRILIVKNGQEVVGICPLYCQTTRHYRVLSVTTLTLLGAVPGIRPAHPGVIAHSGFRELSEIAIMEHLPRLKGWDTLDLDGIDVDSSFAILARKRLKRPRGVVAEEAIKEIDQESLLCTWSEYCARGDGQRALELTRLRKTVTAAVCCPEPDQGIGTGTFKGTYELSICSTRQDLNKSQNVFYSLNQWVAGKGENSKSNAAAQERFYKSIVPEFFVANMLWQLTLKIDGQIVGVQHYFIWRGDLLLFQGAYAPELERLDVAKLMLAYAIKRGIGQVFKCVRVHSLPADFTHSFVSEYMFVSHLRFTPSAGCRIVDKLLKT